MNKDDIRTVLLDELARIAPEVDGAGADPTGDLREEFDIDSMDFLNLVTALHERFGRDIPEVEYRRLASIDGAVNYLSEKLEGVEPSA